MSKLSVYLDSVTLTKFVWKKIGEGRFLIRLLEIMLLLTFPTMRAIDIHITIALNLD